MKKLFSIILPIYGNEKNLPVTIPYIIEHLKLFENYNVEIIMVNDGSPDNSYEIMKDYQKKYPKLIRIAGLTRNFGQSAAMRCGMDMARGDVIGIISADLQDPFELFAEMLEAWEQGSKLVIATRQDREEKGIGALCSKLFHRIVNKHINKKYPKGGFDFFLMDREVADKYRSLDKVQSSLQLLLLWLGYDYKEIKYKRKARKLGKSGYNLTSKIDIAIRIFVHWTDYPIKMIMFLGALLLFLGLITSVLDAILFCVGLDIYMIWDIIFVLCVFTGLVLTSLGIVGEYIWRNFEFNKQLPRYLVAEKYGEGNIDNDEHVKNMVREG